VLVLEFCFEGVYFCSRHDTYYNIIHKTQFYCQELMVPGRVNS
jgi:hypothetical protein